MADRASIDLERWLRGVVEVRNDGGGRGYEQGVRTYACPLCGDGKGRGWCHVPSWTVGCFNVGCDAEPRLAGGAVEFARRVLGLADRAAAWRVLARDFGGDVVVERVAVHARGPDFCRFPAGMRGFDTAAPMRVHFEAFVRAQWGVDLVDARAWNLGWCLTGPYAFRVIVPVVMGGVPVGFQARTVRGTEPKYLTSSCVAVLDRPAECARHAAAMLFNVDALPPEGSALVVEGAGDVMGWGAAQRRCGELRGTDLTAVGLLGVALTPEKLALLASRRLERAVVALDAEPGAQRRALGHVEDLRAWGIPASLGRWVGGKDAGTGAGLVEVLDDGRVSSAVRARVDP